MSRYLLFTFDDYYPAGGMYDFRGLYESIEDAKTVVETEKASYQNAQIVEHESMKVVLTGYSSWDKPFKWKDQNDRPR